MIRTDITGRIGSVAVVEYQRDGETLKGARISVASNEGTGDNQVTTWLTCMVWSADRILPYLTVGRMVRAAGHLTSRTVDKEGTSVTYYTLKVDHGGLEFLGSAPKSAPIEADIEAAAPPKSSRKASKSKRPTDMDADGEMMSDI